MRLEGFLATTDEDFEWSLQMNFFIALRATRAAVASMVERGGGAIVNVASVNAFYHPDSAVMDYGAAKAALVNLTKALSQELGPQGIRINSVSRITQARTDSRSARTESPRPSLGRPASTPSTTRHASGSWRAWAESRPGGSRHPKRSPRSSCCLHPSVRTANVTGANYVIDGGLIKTT